MITELYNLGSELKLIEDGQVKLDKLHTPLKLKAFSLPIPIIPHKTLLIKFEKGTSRPVQS